MRPPKTGRFMYGQRSRRAFTLLEMLVVLAILSILIAGVVSAFSTGINIERQNLRRRQQASSTAQMEHTITEMLEGATLAESTTDATSYFLGGMSVGAGSTASQTASGPSSLTSGSSSGSSGGGTSGNSDDGTNDLGAQRITFTTTWPGVSYATMGDQDDWDTQQNNSVGPVGGLTEVSIGTTAQGTPTDNETGLFQRVQRPSDGDSSQGGMESVLAANVQEIGFSFWDGTQWATSWDTTSTTADGRRLPAAVEVQYILKDDPSQTVHVFVVPIPNSDVTPNNPITTTTTSS